MEIEPCCVLAAAPYKDGRVIYETDNFFVCAGLGAMGVDGYLLIVSREHYEGTGDIPEEQHRELDELVVHSRRILLENYGRKSTVFEHGPRVGRCGWGGCIDHMHLHVIPGVDITREFAVDLIEKLDRTDTFYRVDRTEGFKRTMDIFQGRKTSYVMLEAPDSRRFVSEVNFPGQSQWMRRLVAQQVGARTWNWRMEPDMEGAMRTAEKLQGKF